MVERKLNKPAFKVRAFPTAWLQEIKTSTWFCKNCSCVQDKGTVAYEMYVRFARKNADKDVDKHVRLYLCMLCAELMLTTTLTKVQLIKNHGADGFKMFEEV